MKQYLPFISLFVSGIAMAALPEDAVNLSKYETANCYIISPGTSGYFDCTKKGNSKTESVGEVEEARLIWQTAPSLVNSIDFDKETGHICVATSGEDGNALVAAVDKDGKVLWSWHLWITDYDPATDFTTPPASSGKSWTFMSRNLGAITDERGSFDNFGLLYQWGRKDPFPGAIDFTIMDPTNYTYVKDGEPELYDIDNKILPKVPEKKQFHGTLALSIENPDVFYAMTYNHTGEYDEYNEEIVKNDWPSGDWAEVSDDDFWGGESDKKTIYDPSPVGYRVPVCDEDGNTPYDWLNYASMTWDTKNKGAEQDGQWFPATGTRAYASGTLDYPEGGNPYSGLWIGTKGKMSSNPELYPDVYGQYMFIINGKRTFKVSKDKRSQGLSLRCVRDENFDMSAIENISSTANSENNSVYNLQGVKVADSNSPQSLKSLLPGIYISNSRKIIIR